MELRLSNPPVWKGGRGSDYELDRNYGPEDDREDWRHV